MTLEKLGKPLLATSYFRGSSLGKNEPSKFADYGFSPEEEHRAKLTVLDYIVKADTEGNLSVHFVGQDSAGEEFVVHSLAFGGEKQLPPTIVHWDASTWTTASHEKGDGSWSVVIRHRSRLWSVGLTQTIRALTGGSWGARLYDHDVILSLNEAKELTTLYVPRCIPPYPVRENAAEAA